jgi:integrase
MLTDLECRKAKPSERPYKLSDGGGLYLEITPKGQRYWRLKYRLHGKEKRLALGVFPQISLLDARAKRQAAKDAIAANIDPAAQKRENKRLERYKSDQTFELVAREWHAYKFKTWSPQHANDILYRLNKEVFPQIGRYPMTSLTVPLVHTCLLKIEEHSPEMARRCYQYCSQVFRHAVITGRAERDIMVDLKGCFKKFKRGHYAAIEVEDLPDLIKAINENKRRLYRQTILAIRFLMLTFVRTKELRFATWDEFNLEKAEWHIPAERMKMKNPHIVPLSKQAIEIFMELQEMNGKRDYVFPSIVRPIQPMSECTVLSGLKRLGYTHKMTGHGFRSLAMSVIKEKLGYRHEVVDRQLAHAPRNKVDKAYDRAKFLDERRKMMQDYADYIDGMS